MKTIEEQVNELFGDDTYVLALYPQGKRGSAEEARNLVVPVTRDQVLKAIAARETPAKVIHFEKASCPYNWENNDLPELFRLEAGRYYIGLALHRDVGGAFGSNMLASFMPDPIKTLNLGDNYSVLIYSDNSMFIEGEKEDEVWAHVPIEANHG